MDHTSHGRPRRADAARHADPLRQVHGWACIQERATAPTRHSFEEEWLSKWVNPIVPQYSEKVTPSDTSFCSYGRNPGYGPVMVDDALTPFRGFRSFPARHPF
jgi:hypothetical protein